MTALSAAELAAIRTDIETLLPDTCNILTRTLTPDGSGGQTETWGTATASVACRLDPARGREAEIGGQTEPFYGFILTLPHGTALTALQRVELNSETFAVVSVDTGKSWSASVRGYLERE
jgi:head-tail adaptor